MGAVYDAYLIIKDLWPKLKNGTITAQQFTEATGVSPSQVSANPTDYGLTDADVAAVAADPVTTDSALETGDLSLYSQPGSPPPYDVYDAMSDPYFSDTYGVDSDSFVDPSAPVVAPSALDTPSGGPLPGAQGSPEYTDALLASAYGGSGVAGSTAGAPLASEEQQQQSDPYTWAMDPARYAEGFTDLNAGWNADMLGRLDSTGDWYRSQLGGYQGSVDSITKSMLGLGIDRSGIDAALAGMKSAATAGNEQLQGAIDFSKNVPDRTMKQFLAYAPQLQGLVSGQMSGLERDVMARNRRMAADVTSQLGSEFAGMGALYSGAFGDFTSKRVAEGMANSQIDLQQRQLGLTGQLWGQGLGEIGAGNRLAAQLGMTGAQSQAQLGMQPWAAQLGTESDLARALYGGQMGAYGQQLGIYGQLAGQALGAPLALAGMAAQLQPDWQAPDLFSTLGTPYSERTFKDKWKSWWSGTGWQ